MERIIEDEITRANTLMQMKEDLDYRSDDFKEGYYLGAERMTEYKNLLLELYGRYDG